MKYWVSCRKFTVQVNTDDNEVIVRAAPIVRKFIGQPLDNLRRWASHWPPLQVVKLSTSS